MSDSSTTFDTVLDLCRDQQRRIVLVALADEKRALTVRDLTQAIVKHDHNTPLTEISEEVVTRIHISLHHRHLPKLEAAGIIEYDPERNVVELTDEFDRLEPVLSAIIDTDPNLDSPIE